MNEMFPVVLVESLQFSLASDIQLSLSMSSLQGREGFHQAINYHKVFQLGASSLTRN